MSRSATAVGQVWRHRQDGGLVRLEPSIEGISVTEFGGEQDGEPWHLTRNELYRDYELVMERPGVESEPCICVDPVTDPCPECEADHDASKLTPSEDEGA